MQAFDTTLALTSPTIAYVRTALRDSACDRYVDKTVEEIASVESREFRSVNHASQVCSLLTAYRLIDVIYGMEHPEDALCAPSHQRLQVDFKNFKVAP